MAMDFPNAPTVGQTYLGYVWDGATWQLQGSSTFGAVRYDIAQGLSGEVPPYGVTVTQRARGRSNIYAAPFDALAYSGMQVNSSFDVSQELGTAGLTAFANNTKYLVDGWQIQANGGVTISSIINNATVPPGYSQAIQIYPTVADPSPAANDFCRFVHPIEGYRVARLGWGTVNAQPLTIAFWVYAFRAGNYSGSVRNGGATRSYPFPFTIVAANTWEYKTVTIPGDTTGTWAKDNTAGMTISITLMAGTTFTAPANAWVNGNFAGVNGTANSVTTTSDYMLIAGIIVLPGVEAPSSARLPLIMRPFDQELILCKRYWQLIMPDLRAYSSAAGAFYSFTYNAADMRANPTITVVAAGTTSNASGFTPANFSNRNGELRVVLTAAGIGDCYVNGRTFSLDARL